MFDISKAFDRLTKEVKGCFDQEKTNTNKDVNIHNSCFKLVRTIYIENQKELKAGRGQETGSASHCYRRLLYYFSSHISLQVTILRLKGITNRLSYNCVSILKRKRCVNQVIMSKLDSISQKETVSHCYTSFLMQFYPFIWMYCSQRRGA